MRIGLKVKIYRTAMLTTRAQCGGRTSTRSHVAKAFVTQLERMADTASPYAKPCHQELFWKFLYVWRCRSLSSTSSLFSGISCSPVRWGTSITGCQQTSVSPRARTACVLQIKAKLMSGNMLTRFCISFLHSLSCNALNHPKHSRAYDLGG